MTAKEFYEQYDIKALYELPKGLVALREEDLFKMMDDYAQYRKDTADKVVETATELIDLMDTEGEPVEYIEDDEG